MTKKEKICLISAVFLVAILCANPSYVLGVTRESKIPAGALKIIPQTDVNPPKSFSAEYYDPIPVPGLVNSAGAEDSAFITPDSQTLYFFFTPDVKVPVEKQLVDGVTGIYVSKKIKNGWSKPTRIILQNKNKVALDGCEFIQGNMMLFCSVREGYNGIHWFSAQYKNGKWQNWKNADFNRSYQVGELHISSTGKELYFHSNRTGGQGGLDIWISKKIKNKWQAPENISAVNTMGDEGWPALNPASTELWFNRDYAVWRSKKVNGLWQAPEKMFSPLAGEPSIDKFGNVYFTHHFYKDNQMIEADIYVAYKK